MEVKKIVEGMTAVEVAEVIDSNFKGLDEEKANKKETDAILSELGSEVERNSDAIGLDKTIAINSIAFSNIVVGLKAGDIIKSFNNYNGYIVLSNTSDFVETESYNNTAVPITLTEDYNYLRTSIDTTNSSMVVERKGLKQEFNAFNEKYWGKSNLMNKSVVQEKLNGIFRESINLIDIRKATQGYYVLPETGNLASNSNYYASDYIPIIGGLNYYISFKHTIAYYDGNKKYISGVQSADTNKIQTAPERAMYMRCSISSGSYNAGRCVVSQSNDVVDYIPYIEPYLEESHVFPIIEYSKNLFNPNDENVVQGKYVNGVVGTLVTNASYYASGYIPVKDGKTYYLPSCRGMSWYDKDKKFINGLPNGTEGTNFVAPTGAMFMRCSIPISSFGSWIVAESEGVVDYVPYSSTGIKKEFIPNIPASKLSSINAETLISSLGKDSIKVKKDSLSDGEIISLSDFPYYLKKGNCLSFGMSISSFSSIDFGHGNFSYRGKYIRITATHVQEVHVTDSLGEWVKTSKEHGLNISSFIKCAITRDGSGNVLVVIMTLSGHFTTTFDMGYEMNGAAFLKSTGTIGNNVVITAGNTDFKKPVWMIGDSYFGISTNRWPGVVRNWGYFNFLISGLAGLTSSAAFSELSKLLNFGTPKYLVWCLGMNDSDANFISNFKNVKTICESKGITMIASTIPTIPTRDKETISQYVIDSGVRYIDFYFAVGADSEGNWNDGYLSSDGIHPTELGAQALAMQVLIDFPELMQYGLVSTDSEIGDITGDL